MGVPEDTTSKGPVAAGGADSCCSISASTVRKQPNGNGWLFSPAGTGNDSGDQEERQELLGRPLSPPQC